MAKKHIQPGKTMPYTNSSGSAIAAGDPVDLGGMVGIALGDIADGATGNLAICEVWEMTKTAAVAITQGEDVYLAAAGTIGTTGTDTPAGKAFAAAAGGDATVQVLLNV